MAKENTLFKPTYGKVGVEFHYYKANEFRQLKEDQIEKLKAHREKYGRHEYTPGNNGGNKPT